MKFLKKPYVYATLFSTILATGFTYSLLETFVLAHAVTTVSSTSQELSAEAKAQLSTATKTETSYQDDHLTVQLETIRQNDTTIYVADIQTDSSDLLKTALAQDTYGTNITQKTSTIASDHQAILAVNGDYYGANTQGYVIKNGVIYRDTVREDAENGDLAIFEDGHMEIIYEKEISAQELLDQGVVNLLAFGPSLIEDGEITVDTNSEVGKSMSSNPRSAIGIIDENHYVIVVSDGRTSESAGLTLYELAEVLQSYGATTAYNLDGGGSSTLYFNGQVVNKPTTNGNISERAVSDIVYFGY